MKFRGTADIMEWNGAILNLADATVLYQDQKQELTKNEFKDLADASGKYGEDRKP